MSRARPPTTPPTIAPMGVVLLLLLEAEAAIEFSADAAPTDVDETVNVCRIVWPAPFVAVKNDVCTIVVL
jgi:hypothetical protein